MKVLAWWLAILFVSQPYDACVYDPNTETAIMKTAKDLMLAHINGTPSREPAVSPTALSFPLNS
jgi:hypothetical protein